MKQIIALSLLLSLTAPAMADLLPAGTPVQVALDKEVDHDNVKNGQVISGHVVAPVKHNGSVVIPAGTEVKGVVSQRKNNFIFGVPGSIELTSFKINDKDGVIPLNGSFQRKGDSRIAISLVGAYFLGLPIFIKGQDGIIESGSEATMYTVQEWGYEAANKTAGN